MQEKLCRKPKFGGVPASALHQGRRQFQPVNAKPGLPLPGCRRQYRRLRPAIRGTQADHIGQAGAAHGGAKGRRDGLDFVRRAEYRLKPGALMSFVPPARGGRPFPC